MKIFAVVSYLFLFVIIIMNAVDARDAWKAGMQLPAIYRLLWAIFWLMVLNGVTVRGDR